MTEPERCIEERTDCAIGAKIEVNDRRAIAVTVRDISSMVSDY